MNEDLRARVEAWIADDPDPDTKAELQKLLDEDAEAELEDRFQGLLQFGTAGLRGLLGGGPHRMNRAVVIRATAGLCRYLLETTPDAKERGICIGYDGRRKSVQFAKDAAEVVAGHGIRARVFDHVVPTPVLGYAVVQTHAAGGIMVTASHNPPDYNGYKVYWGNGAQIIPPHDSGIAAKIGAIETISDVARQSDSELVETFTGEIELEYLAKVKALALHPETPRDLKIVYTAMHGVGGKDALAALKDVGFTDVHVVKEQQEPDGEFPTVAFPNPEEDGAMDMALALAKKHDADLIIANDPDADRLATIVKHEGAYRPLSGNEIGCLLAHYLLDQGSGKKRLVLCSVVSSPMLLAIGEAHDVRAEQTLTGHKWIHNRAMELEPEGYTFVFGFEEALGYAISPLVRDKDGVSAAAVMCDMAAWCKSQGRTLVDELELMWRRYGMFLSEQVSLVLPGAEGAQQIAAGMARARAETPKSLGGLAVIAVQDFETGLRTAMGPGLLRSGEPATAKPERRDSQSLQATRIEGSRGSKRPHRTAQTKLAFPKANVVVWDLEGGHRAMLRPSGTEPKLKLYFDVRVDIAEGESIDAARTRGQKLLSGIVKEVRAALPRVAPRFDGLALAKAGMLERVGRIFDVVPRSRRYASDFKCSSPGEDEAKLLLKLAELARCDVEYLDRKLPGELPGHDVILYARARNGRMKLTMQREKYAFPPVAILRYLNGVLREENATRRLVACRDGVPWEPGNDGAVVVLIDTGEEQQLRDAGVEIHDDPTADSRFCVEPM